MSPGTTLKGITPADDAPAGAPGPAAQRASQAGGERSSHDHEGRRPGQWSARTGDAGGTRDAGVEQGPHTLRDPSLVAAEGARLERWIDELAASA
jgi:hypothetical protein